MNDMPAANLANGSTTAEALAEACLAAIADPDGEGRRAFLACDPDKVRDQARHADAMRRHGVVPSPIAGLPVSIKDLFDVAGERTTAGSKVLVGVAPATRDAPAVARLRAAGAVLMGRTNMTEFAYSGVGMNPHHGTPSSPWDRACARVPGGSTAGGAVSVADGMAAIALGSDTGGSCRIPAALCGIVGFKPTASRVPLDGAFPLAASLDSIGPLTTSVALAALTDAVLAGETPENPVPVAPNRLRIAVPRTLVLDGLEEPVARAFEAALDAMSKAGVVIEDIALAEFGELPDLAVNGGIAGAEAYAVHAARIADAGDGYDPRVRARILMARDITLAEYRALLARRADIAARIAVAIADFDAICMPTVPIVAPPASAFADDDEFVRLNRLLLRNPSTMNLADGCSISLPCHQPGEACVGLMLSAAGGRDRHLFRVASAVEAILEANR